MNALTNVLAVASIALVAMAHQAYGHESNRIRLWPESPQTPVCGPHAVLTKLQRPCTCTYTPARTPGCSAPAKPRYAPLKAGPAAKG
jgi:hypothetical protein